MVFIKAGADVTFATESKLTPLHLACIKGSTISALTLLNNGADCDAQDIFEITPYGYALKNNHEDLCIFLIQKENDVDIPINELVKDDTHICHQLGDIENMINSDEVTHLLEKKTELEKLTDIEQLNKGYKKLKTHSPFYYAIKNNMQGNIYLLLQKGFDQYSALCESIIHNKYNFFLSVIDTIDTKGLHKLKTVEGKNLLHVLAESYNSSQVAHELFDEVYKLIIDLKFDANVQDDYGRLPLHYALKNQTVDIATRLLDGMSAAEKVKALNTEDNEGLTAFSMLYYKASRNEGSQSPLGQFYNLLGSDIHKLNPFVRFNTLSFPYSFLSYVLEDGAMIHPLILLLDSVDINSIDSLKIDIENLNLEQHPIQPNSKKRKKYERLNFIDWLFKLGKVNILKNNYFKKTVHNYLKNKRNAEKIEGILATPLRDDIYINVPRIISFVDEVFGVKLKVQGFDPKGKYKEIKADVLDHHYQFEEGVKILYDYEADSEKYLEKKIPELEKEMLKSLKKKGKVLECVLDSDQPNEKQCIVVKDEGDTEYYFDAVMKKVDLKKYYYGLDNFYVIQLLKDEVKDLYILWTRWGRTGTDGQYQRTPFNSLELAKNEFFKVFKQKSGWAWKDVKNYVKLPKKYELKRIGGKLLIKNDSKLSFSKRDIDYEQLMISMKDIESNVKQK